MFRQMTRGCGFFARIWPEYPSIDVQCTVQQKNFKKGGHEPTGSGGCTDLNFIIALHGGKGRVVKFVGSNAIGPRLQVDFLQDKFCMTWAFSAIQS